MLSIPAGQITFKSVFAVIADLIAMWFFTASSIKFHKKNPQFFARRMIVYSIQNIIIFEKQIFTHLTRRICFSFLSQHKFYIPISKCCFKCVFRSVIFKRIHGGLVLHIVFTFRKLFLKILRNLLALGRVNNI